MSNHLLDAKRLPKVSLAVSIAAFALFTTVCLLGDMTFKTRLTTALVERSISDVDGLSPGETVAEIPVVGTEDFWLGYAKGLENVNGSWSDTLSKGDRISIQTKSGNRVLHVADVSALSPEITHIDTGSGAPLVMVTAREIDRPNGLIMRFVVEINSTGSVDALSSQVGAKSELSDL